MAEYQITLTEAERNHWLNELRRVNPTAGAPLRILRKLESDHVQLDPDTETGGTASEDEEDSERIDGRRLRHLTGKQRTAQFATRVTPELDARIRKIAADRRLQFNELLELAVDALEKSFSQ